MARTETDEMLGVQEALAIIEHDLLRLSSFRLAWQSIATQLWKLLGDRSSGPLITRALADPTLHPLCATIPSGRYEAYLPGNIILRPFGVEFDYFDESSPPIRLEDWMKQILFVNGQDVTIGDLLELSRHNETAHYGKHLCSKFASVKNGFSLKVPDAEDYTSLHLNIFAVGSYVVRRVSELAGFERPDDLGQLINNFGCALTSAGLGAPEVDTITQWSSHTLISKRPFRRQAGKVCVLSICAGPWSIFDFGLQATGSGDDFEHGMRIDSRTNTIRTERGAEVGQFTSGTNQLAIVLRGRGAHLLHQAGGHAWKLLWVSDAGEVGELLPCIKTRLAQE